MNTDPFDRLRNANPADPSAVSPPMATADRIMSAGSGIPGWAVSVAAAALVVVVGGGSILLFGDSGENTVVADGSTTSSIVSTTVPATTTVASSSPTTEAASTSTTGATGSEGVALQPFETIAYFFADGVADTAQSGPYLIPVRLLADGVDVAAASMSAVLDGPPGNDPALSTAVPTGTALRSVTVDRGLATVDLTSEFVAGGGSFSMRGRLAQVIFTLTAIDGIDGVAFLIDGASTTVFGGEGVEVSGAAERSEFQDLVPAIMIESPAYGAAAGWPLQVSGVANVFEATVSLALTDADGLIIWEGFTTATCGTGCWGEWSTTVTYDVLEPQMGALIAWEESARDGSQTNIREHPVWLVPGPTNAPGACSGALVDDPLTDQPGLPAGVAAIRQQLFDAATACDWEQLRSLQADGFRYTFGVGDDAVGYWVQIEERLGGEPMRYLAELLNRPFAIDVLSEPDLWVWPSAHVSAWGDVPEADREALRPLYDDTDFAAFAQQGGYLGFRIGITESGEWLYFIEGD